MASDSTSICRYGISILGELVINTSVYTFDRIKGTGEPHPFTEGWKHLKPSEWKWDTSLFDTNFNGHPFHGGLYHAVSRFGGLSFYEAVPMNAIGSGMWELGAEHEAPSINDLFVTTFAGAAFGEVIYKTANAIIHHNYDDMSVSFSTDAEFQRSYVIQTIGMDLELGNVLDDGTKPYSYFKTHVKAARLKDIYLKEMHIYGRLLSKSIDDHVNIGLWQHFHLYNLLPTRLYDDYKIAEAASLGVGVVSVNDPISLSFHASAIGMGAVDNLENKHRKYDYVYGFSLKQHAKCKIFSFLDFNADIQSYHTWAWEAPYDRQINLVVSPSIELRLSPHVALEGFYNGFMRYGRNEDIHEYGIRFNYKLK